MHHSPNRFNQTYCFSLLLATLIFTGLISTSCSNKNIQPETKERYFILGSGGGFSGLYEEYKVHRTGQVEWYDFKAKKYMPYSVMTPKLTKQTFDKLEALGIESKNIDKPGNFTYYIELTSGDNRHKIKWNDELRSSLIDIQRFFNKTEGLLKNLK